MSSPSPTGQQSPHVRSAALRRGRPGVSESARSGPLASAAPLSLSVGSEGGPLSGEPRRRILVRLVCGQSISDVLDRMGLQAMSGY